MHWILQENLFKESEWDNLVGTLERFDIPHSVHKVVPFIGELQPPPAPKHPLVVCFGSYSMRHAAKLHGWTPGVFDLFDINFTVQLQRWGKLLLNHDCTVVPFRAARLTEPAFVRPIDDSKYFAGKVFEPDEFNEWVHKVVELKEDYGNSLSGDTLVQICRPKKIYAEYRFWIVDKQLVTWSLYKRGSKVIYSSNVDGHVIQFANQVMRHGDITLAVITSAWQPARA